MATVATPEDTSRGCRAELADLIPHWAAAGASGATIALLAFLWADDRPDEYQSVRWLAEQVGLSAGRVQECTAEAARLGLLAVTNAGPRSKTWRRVLPIPPAPVDICPVCAVGRADDPDGLCSVCAAGRADRGESARPAARSTYLRETDKRISRWAGVDDDGYAIAAGPLPPSPEVAEVVPTIPSATSARPFHPRTVHPELEAVFPGIGLTAAGPPRRRRRRKARR